MNHNFRAKVYDEGDLKFETRVCHYKCTYFVTRYDDADPDPRYRTYTPALFECFDIVDMTITLYDNSGEEIGCYSEGQIPRAEWSLWMNLLEKKIKVNLHLHVNDFNWSATRAE